MSDKKKEIKKWEPDDFELEMTSVWSFPNRGNWATPMQNGEEIGHRTFQEIFCFAIQKRMTGY